MVGGVLGVGVVGGEEDVGLVVGGGEGEDVPGVGGDDPRLRSGQATAAMKST